MSKWVILKINCDFEKCQASNETQNLITYQHKKYCIKHYYKIVKKEFKYD